MNIKFTGKRKRIAHPTEDASLLPVAKKQRVAKKRVIFTTVTTFTFAPEYGRSSVPTDGGVALGMAPKHLTGISLSIEQYERSRHRDRDERSKILSKYYTEDELEAFARVTQDISRSRERTIQEFLAAEEGTCVL